MLVNRHRHWMTASFASNSKLNETFARSCIMMSTKRLQKIWLTGFCSLCYFPFDFSYEIFCLEESERRKRRKWKKTTIRLFVYRCPCGMFTRTSRSQRDSTCRLHWLTSRECFEFFEAILIDEWREGEENFLWHLKQRLLCLSH